MTMKDGRCPISINGLLQPAVAKKWQNLQWFAFAGPTHRGVMEQHDLPIGA
jgi:hypothetical protein